MMPAHCPALDFDRALQCFESAFVVAASEQPLLQPLIQSGQLLEQSRIQRELLDYVKRLFDFISQIAPGSLTIEAGQVSGHDVTVGTKIVQQTAVIPPAMLADWEAHYLRTLQRDCEQLDLAAIDDEHVVGRASRPVHVSDVFTTLNLKGPGRRPDQTVEAWFKVDADPRGERRGRHAPTVPIQAIEAISAVNRLVILGQPGGGKSTVINHVAAQLAARRLGGMVTESQLPGWPEADRPLPVHIVLRRLASWLPDSGPIDVGLIWDYLSEQLKQMGCREAFDKVKATLVDEGGILFFDGLDEVREEDDRRKRSRITTLIDKVATQMPQCSIVVTCREYAYRQSDDWKLSPANFPHVVELDGFNEAQIAAFAQTWFVRVVGSNKGWDGEQSDKEAQKLIAAIDSRPDLGKMARSPLLLTLMAQVHASSGGLPDDRADLYRRAVNLLLAHWENRIVRERDGSFRVEPGLVMQLGLKVATLRDPLAEVAFRAHERQESEADRDEREAAIPKIELLETLKSWLGSADQAERVIGYIQERAGLLVADGIYAYRFPHRTFQEYLAAVYLKQQDKWEQEIARRVQRDFVWWREVYLLVAGLSRETPGNVATVAHQLLGSLQPTEPVPTSRSDEVQLVARALIESGFAQHAEREQPAGRFRDVYAGTQRWLMAVMRGHGPVVASERAAAGRLLAALGDPRQAVTDVDQMPFCVVPRGPFWMGAPPADGMASDNERPFELYPLDYDYWLAQYPVTQAQFAAFVADEGYRQPRHWRLAAAAGYWSGAGFMGQFDDAPRRAPHRYGQPFDVSNHPAVGVNWFEAMAFCHWLTERWQTKGWLPAGWQLRLPNEPEWEKAARGGMQILQPVRPPRVVRDRLRDREVIMRHDHALPQQRFPWGDDADPQRANYDESNIGTTSAVGCFSGGKSPYGVEEMSGNVWEWTRTLHGYDYPYDPVDGRESLANETLHKPRVLRGGSFLHYAQYVRCAARSWNDPDLRPYDVGFRMLVSPPLFLRPRGSGRTDQLCRPTG